MISRITTCDSLGTPYWSSYLVSEEDTSNYSIDACMEDGINPNHGGVWSSGYTSTDDSYFGWANDFPDVIVDLTYVSGSPVPSSGGNIYFDVYLENTSGQTLDFDAWLDIAYMGFPTTVVQRAFENYLPGWAINRPNMYYPIPSTYASGFYTMYARAGEHPSVIWAEDSFAFMKLGDNQDSDFIPWIPENLPDYFGEIEFSKEIPEEHLYIVNSPNPFNPTTVLSYELRVASKVNLTVYDVAGTKVAELANGWRDAGNH